MKTLIRMSGYVFGANVLEPFAAYPKDQPRYELLIIPEHCDSYENEILPIVEYLKGEHEKQKYLPDPSYEDHEEPVVKDRVVVRECLKFESLFKPRLEGELADLATDYELVTKFIQVVGHVQIQEFGNCFLSFHIVEPAVHSADKIDR